MKKKFLFFLIILLNLSAIAQKTTISGYVLDKQTGEKLIGANILIKNTSKGAVANNFGFYSLSVNNSDTINLIISYIGYKAQNKTIIAQQNQKINFYLESSTEIDAVTVTATKPIEQRTEMGVVEIPMKQLELIPTLGAEADIMKAYQLMPGVQSGNEGGSGLYVRGGSPDENLILVDDVPLYYVNHLGGFISVFNADAINSVKLIKGGFPARYGSRLSSVMDVRMKDGNMKEFHGNVSMGIITSKIALEGPIKKDKASFFISARGMPWELIYRPFTALTTGYVSMGYNFYDINTKLNYKISSKDRIYFSFYKGDDNAVVKLIDLYDISGQKGNMTLRWGNTLGAFRWNHLFNQKLFSNTTVAYTKYRYTTEYNFGDRGEQDKFFQQFSTSINDITLKSDLEYSATNNYKIIFGFNSIFHDFSPGNTKYSITESGQNIMDTTINYANLQVPENRIYVENIFEIGKFVSGNIGLHASHYFVEHTNFYSLQPRLLLNFMPTRKISFKASYSEMQQNVHLLTSSTITMPMDIWIPATKEIKPSKSKQIAAGVYKSFGKGQYEFSLETYYKTSDNLIAYKEGTSFGGIAKNWAEKIETGGTGTSYGLEILLQKKQGKTTGWLAYTYSRTERQFENLNNGKKMPFKYDRRHDISLVVSHRFNKNIDLSGTWVYGSGYPYTLPIGKYEMVNEGASNISRYNEQNMWYDETVFIYADRNTYRMRAYHRLDVGMNFRKQKKRGTRTWTISVYNAYNRQNPYYYYTKIKNNKVQLYQQSLFPIIPSISYSFKF